MKTNVLICKATFIIIMSCIYLTGYAQSPQGFNYQAVAHNADGSPMGNTTVGVKITLEDASHVAYYSETHAASTNAQGVFSIIIGNGNRVGNNLFENIPWSKGDVSLKLEVDPLGGTAYAQVGNIIPLQAVPYALYAENTKEIVSQPTALDDDPIFVVKNKAGQVVFAVYQTGVRVYVEDTPVIKGARGGFAVGGLSQSKVGTSAEYFRITSDSARIYVKNPVKKGSRGGFAVGGLSQSKGSDNFMQLTPENYFIGFESGLNITSGLYNSFFGYQSGKYTTSGGNNVFSGYQSGMSNTYGSFNVFNGYQSGQSNTEGHHNVFIGHESGISNTLGWSNNFIGQGAGYSNTTGTNNIFIGNDAGRLNIASSGSIFIGRNAGYNSTEYGNTIVGHTAGEYLATGSNNAFFGSLAGYQRSGGSGNLILGAYSNHDGGSGDNNTIVGTGAGYSSLGSGNVMIGYNAGFSETGSNKLYISNSSTNPLILGDFSAHKVNINTIMNISERSDTPSSPSVGDIVRFKGNTSYPAEGLYIYTGVTWKPIVTW